MLDFISVRKFEERLLFCYKKIITIDFVKKNRNTIINNYIKTKLCEFFNSKIYELLKFY